MKAEGRVSSDDDRENEDKAGRGHGRSVILYVFGTSDPRFCTGQLWSAKVGDRNGHGDSDAAIAGRLDNACVWTSETLFGFGSCFCLTSYSPLRCQTGLAGFEH